MRIKFFCFLLLGTINNSLFAQDFSKKIWDETVSEKQERLEWWTDSRFGMFIHWGIYSQAARHEKVLKRENIPLDKYMKYFEVFNPDLFNPDEWAEKAKEAGMKYAVITCKHHDGFSMFDSEFTDYDVMNSPYAKDIIKEWTNAFRAEGLKIGIYYSLIDWHHPEFTVDDRHILNDRGGQDLAELNKNRDMNKYRSYMKNQLTELLSNYGEIDILWLDYSYPGKHGKGREEWGSVEILKMVRKLQPGIIVNDRADLRDYWGGWDFTTPEQIKVREWPEMEGEKIPWETCQTFSGSWGYYRDEYTWKNNRQLLVLLIESVSKGGNLLLNVGPTARGSFDNRVNKSLTDIGEWMKYNSRSIYHCTQAPEEFETPDNTILTFNPELNRLYIHLLEYPLENFTIPNMKGKIEYVQFLHDASELIISRPRGSWIEQKIGHDDVNLIMPVKKPDTEIPVIEVFLN